jgi:hypothetical protein
MEKILDMVNQNVQYILKKFQDTKNKEYEKTQKQIHELRGALNKHQSETETTIERTTVIFCLPNWSACIPILVPTPVFSLPSNESDVKL